MITDDNKWIFIEAYLAGKLDAPAQDLVRQKMDDDPVFRTDVLIQKALNQQIDQQQQAKDRDLVAKFLATRVLATKTPSTESKDAPVRPLPTPFWQQTWLRAAAAVTLVIGIGWLLQKYVRQPETITIAVEIAYNKRNAGFGGNTTSQRIPFRVRFSSRGPAGGEYSSSDDSLHIYLPQLPADARQWTLSDTQEPLMYQLKTPQGQTYQLEKETYGERKPLVLTK